MMIPCINSTIGLPLEACSHVYIPALGGGFSAASNFPLAARTPVDKCMIIVRNKLKN